MVSRTVLSKSKQTVRTVHMNSAPRNLEQEAAEHVDKQRRKIRHSAERAVASGAFGSSVQSAASESDAPGTPESARMAEQVQGDEDVQQDDMDDMDDMEDVQVSEQLVDVPELGRDRCAVPCTPHLLQANQS